jgi:hypothetical protein
MQFISTEDVERAMLAELPVEAWLLSPIVFGVDVARYGDDRSAIAVRQGRKLHEVRRFRELNTMQLAAEIAACKKDYGGHVAAIFVDGVGVGAGVVDRLQMLGYGVIEVNGGGKAFEEVTFYNKTAEMWSRMRDWLKGADLPSKDPDLRLELVSREYYYDDKERIRLERKKDAKKRGAPSPDLADALAHTFAEELGDIVRNSFEPNEEEPSNNVEPEAA